MSRFPIPSFLSALTGAIPVNKEISIEMLEVCKKIAASDIGTKEDKKRMVEMLIPFEVSYGRFMDAARSAMDNLDYIHNNYRMYVSKEDFESIKEEAKALLKEIPFMESAGIFDVVTVLNKIDTVTVNMVEKFKLMAGGEPSPLPSRLKEVLSGNPDISSLFATNETNKPH